MQTVILLAEDDPDDAELMQLAFRRAGLTQHLEIVPDGGAVVSYLEKAGDHLPSLVLLDQNMPRMRGLEVLSWIRKNPATRAIPVLMLTSSRLKEEVDEAYLLGVNAYFTKPHGIDALVELLQVIERYWFRHAVHPFMPEAAL